MTLFLDYARSTELYKHLRSVPATRDGNLLEYTDDRTAEAQTEFLRWALHLAGPQVVLETGTNKGMFGYLISLLLKGVVLHTLDANPQAAKAVDILNCQQPNVRCCFYEGDSRVTFPALNVGARFAWIDGGHATEVAISDLLQCYRLKVPFIGVDDTAYSTVKNAVDYFLDHTSYKVIPNPFIYHDSRKAVLLGV
jgi:hypothetical protein